MTTTATVALLADGRVAVTVTDRRPPYRDTHATATLTRPETRALIEALRDALKAG